jgi:hypothetical protein
VVSAIYHDSAMGDFLQCDFNASGGADEAHLSVGDSGGGVFIKDGAVWKLAGINYSVDGPFSIDGSGAGFFAAIFDEGGLYQTEGTNWVQTLDGPIDVPSSFYSTRVSAHQTWITNTLQTVLPQLLVATNPAGPFIEMPSAVVNTSAKTVTVSIPASPEFFRLRGCDPSRITTLSISGASLILSYE